MTSPIFSACPHLYPYDDEDEDILYGDNTRIYKDVESDDAQRLESSRLNPDDFIDRSNDRVPYWRNDDQEDDVVSSQTSSQDESQVHLRIHWSPKFLSFCRTFISRRWRIRGG